MEHLSPHLYVTCVKNVLQTIWLESAFNYPVIYFAM